MSHHVPRRALAGVALVITSGILAACGDDQAANDLATDEPTTSATAADDDSQTTTTSAGPEVATIAVSFAGGAVTGGARTETVTLDEPVRIEVSGDVAEEVHVHTYDLFGDVTPDQPAVFEFTADIPGVHEVELEGSHLLLLELQVEP